uniref:Uncharacterized protein n=1 Tax=Oryza punctata TaxID=4537 RepID=A0A0E0JVC2_ORYPU
MPLGKSLLRWLTTGALPLAAAARRAAPSSSSAAVDALPEAARRIILDGPTAAACILPRNHLSSRVFSSMLPRRIVVGELTAASLSQRIKELNAVQAGSTRKHAANSSSPFVPEMSLVLPRWLGAARCPGAEIASKLAGQVRRRHLRLTTTAAADSNLLPGAGGSVDYVEKFFLVRPRRPCSIMVSSASPPLPRWFAAQVADQVRFFGAGDPFDLESDDGGFLADLAPAPAPTISGFPRHHLCATSPPLPRWFAAEVAEQVRFFSAGDPFESDDGGSGLLPDLAAFARRRRRCATVSPISPWLAVAPPRIPGFRPSCHDGNRGCSHISLCFEFEFECIRQGFGDGDHAHSSRLFEFESTHHFPGSLTAADLAPTLSGFPRRRRCAASPPLPQWFAAEVAKQVRFFGAGDPFESDDGGSGLLPDLAAFARRRRCAAVPPISPWLAPPRIPGPPPCHDGSSACSYALRPELCFMSMFEFTRHGFSDGDLAESRGGAGPCRMRNGIGLGVLVVDGIDNINSCTARHQLRRLGIGRKHWQQLVLMSLFSASGSPSTPSSSPTPQAPPPQAQNHQTDSSATCLPDQPQDNLIDETSADEIFSAESYIKSFPILVETQVLGSGATFWRLSDHTSWIRCLGMILKNQHAAGNYLARPLLVCDVLITSSGKLKLRQGTFCKKDKSLVNLNQDYQYMARLIQELILLSNGSDALTKIPSDFGNYIKLLESNQLEESDEIRIVNHFSLLPMKNRSDAFLMMYNHITGVIARSNSKLASNIIQNLPYKKDWFATAGRNTEISKWFRYRRYKNTPESFLDLNRNVRSHPYDHATLIKLDIRIEEALYGEWPDLLVDMQEKLHNHDELGDTDYESKFGK